MLIDPDAFEACFSAWAQLSTANEVWSIRIPDTAGEFRKRFIWRAVGVIVWETQVLVSGK